MATIPASADNAQGLSAATAWQGIQSPYLLFLGDVQDPRLAKTASGIHFWSPEKCLGQLRLPGCKADLGLPEMDVAVAQSSGAKTLVIGMAPAGGAIPDNCLTVLKAALTAGLDIASGMHLPLSSNAMIAKLAEVSQQRLFEMRKPKPEQIIATGAPRTGKRLLTVGTDCGVGKMFASLAIEKAMRQRGLKASFRATGQTGILIAGDGICIDAVTADFMAGAAELLSPNSDPEHWDVIEGQGSLHHPSYAGVSLALLHGSQPDALVVCHDPTRTMMVGLDNYQVVSLEECISTNLAAARRVNTQVRVVGVCANTSAMNAQQAETWIDSNCDRLGVPVCDPIRNGVESILDEMLT